MKFPPRAKIVRGVSITVVLVLAASAFLFRSAMIRTMQEWTKSSIALFRDAPKEDEDSEKNALAPNAIVSLELSAQARRNIGLTDDMIREVTFEKYQKTITVPGMVIVKPGRTHVEVSAPMTGMVTGIYVTKGEALTANRLLFKLRLTHEDLVEAQTNFLRTLGELDVEIREITRLKKFKDLGLIEAVLLEHQYAKDKFDAILDAQREALLLHGLSRQQVATIADKRRLLHEVLISVPRLERHVSREAVIEQTNSTVTAEAISRLSVAPLGAQFDPANNRKPAPLPGTSFIVQELDVHIGQFLETGDTLCVLADLSELYVEGSAFEQDIDDLELAAKNGWTLQAFRPTSQEPEPILGLKIGFLANEIDPETRALRFYVSLPNKVLRQSETPEGLHFIGWKFKPGQRLQLRVPVKEWVDGIVLPVDAVAKDGAEYFVFVQNGVHFDRRPVHVQHRDQISVVIANDGSIFPGDIVAHTGAHQMQMALKNQSGGAPDPHAGHSH